MWHSFENIEKSENSEKHSKLQISITFDLDAHEYSKCLQNSSDLGDSHKYLCI